MHAVLAPFTVLVRPRATFRRLAERPRWIWMFALLVLLAAFLIKTTVTMPQVLEASRQAMEEANVGVSVRAEESESGVRMPKETRAEDGGSSGEEVVIPEGAEDVVETMTVIGSYVFGTLGVLIGTLVLAGVIYAATRIWSKETAFAVVLGMVALAKMPDVVRDIVQTANTAVTGNWTQHAGLGALVAPASVGEAPTIAYALLSMVDVYAIWLVVLLFLGLRIALDLERRRALILTGSFVALGIVFAIVPALIAGAFMPA